MILDYHGISDYLFTSQRMPYLVHSRRVVDKRSPNHSRHLEGATCSMLALQWCHNEHNGILNHQRHNCLPNSLFRRRWKKTSKLRVTGLCEGNSPVTGEFPAQRASNVENVSIWWCHHGWWQPTEISTQLCTVPRVFILYFHQLSGAFTNYCPSVMGLQLTKGQ